MEPSTLRLAPAAAATPTPVAARPTLVGRVSVTVVPVQRPEDGGGAASADSSESQAGGSVSAGAGGGSRNIFRIVRSMSIDKVLQALARSMVASFGLKRFEGAQASRIALRTSGGVRVVTMDDLHDGASYVIDVEGDPVDSGGSGDHHEHGAAQTQEQ